MRDSVWTGTLNSGVCRLWHYEVADWTKFLIETPAFPLGAYNNIIIHLHSFSQIHTFTRACRSGEGLQQLTDNHSTTLEQTLLRPADRRPGALQYWRGHVHFCMNAYPQVLFLTCSVCGVYACVKYVMSYFYKTFTLMCLQWPFGCRRSLYKSVEGIAALFTLLQLVLCK